MKTGVTFYLAVIAAAAGLAATPVQAQERWSQGQWEQPRQPTQQAQHQDNSQQGNSQQANDVRSVPALPQWQSLPQVDNASYPVMAVAPRSPQPSSSHSPQAASPYPAQAAPLAQSEPALSGGINLSQAEKDGKIESFEQAVMRRHNAARKETGAKPLVWDKALADHALAYAKQLAQRDKGLRHAQDLLDLDQGENLWAGTYGHFMPAKMIDDFLSEKQYYKPGAFPNVSTTGQWTDVGHYTQIIWPTTQKVGCGLAESPDRTLEYLVCRYYPAGNIIGVTLEK